MCHHKHVLERCMTAKTPGSNIIRVLLKPRLILCKFCQEGGHLRRSCIILLHTKAVFSGCRPSSWWGFSVSIISGGGCPFSGGTIFEGATLQSRTDWGNLRFASNGLLSSIGHIPVASCGKFENRTRCVYADAAASGTNHTTVTCVSLPWQSVERCFRVAG